MVHKGAHIAFEIIMTIAQWKPDGLLRPDKWDGLIY